jgi:hypothetical protein
MKNFVAVMIFSLLTIGFFAGFSNWGIPDLVPAPPPEEDAVDFGAMTMDQFVAQGARLLEGKGTCLLCHNPVGGRAPLLDAVAQVAEARIADPAYAGAAGDAQSYLYESMVEPSVFVVPGFGKKGTNDTESPMPNVLSGGIGFSDAEVLAVIAYLQSSGGVAVTVEIPSDAAVEDDENEGDGEGRELFESPEDIIEEMACGTCHLIADEEGDLGPDLTAIGASRDASYLRRSILDPNADIAEGFEEGMMPDDYGEQMYASELEMLVTYLAGLK